MKIKLPRKRKKRCIKKIGRSDYKLCVIANEVLAEENIKGAEKFPKVVKRDGNGFAVRSYW